MHGGFPLDSETVVSEALALKMAVACDGLVLTGLPYFYAGATASGRGMVQVSVRLPIVYMDMMIQMGRQKPDWLKDIAASFHAMTVGAYQIMGRLEDIPLTTAYEHNDLQSCSRFSDPFGLAYQSAAAGYCFADARDHMSTPVLPDEKTRRTMAERLWMPAAWNTRGSIG